MTPDELRERGVRAVAPVLVDNAGITRMKCVSIDRLARAAERGVGWPTVWGLSLADDSFAHDPELHSPSGGLRLRADLDTVTVLGCAPGWGRAPIDHHEQSGEPWAGCQRRFLRSTVERATGLGFELMAARELEWTVGADGPDGFEALHSGPGYGTATSGDTGGFMLELLDSLGLSGVTAEQIHPEYSDGQIELSLTPRRASPQPSTRSRPTGCCATPPGRTCTTGSSPCAGPRPRRRPDWMKRRSSQPTAGGSR